jgi:four helix bundle protein
MLRHETLVAWQRADDLFIKIHRIVRLRFPYDERFELSRPIRRAAYSVPANIVEGLARRSPREKLHFLHIAQGSLAEVSYRLHAARRLGYLDEAEYSRLRVVVNMAGAPLCGTREIRMLVPSRVITTHP